MEHVIDYGEELGQPALPSARDRSKSGHFQQKSAICFYAERQVSLTSIKDVLVRAGGRFGLFVFFQKQIDESKRVTTRRSGITRLIHAPSCHRKWHNINVPYCKRDLEMEFP